jgi:hypothetical protein
MTKDGPVVSDEEKLRLAEAEKKKTDSLADSYDLDQAELKKKIEAEKVKRETMNDALDEDLNIAYERLRTRESHMIMELMNTKREAVKRKDFLDRLEKIPLENDKKFIKTQKDALKQWHVDVQAYLNYINEENHFYDLKMEFFRLIKEDRADITKLRTEQIVRGIKLDEATA